MKVEAYGSSGQSIHHYGQARSESESMVSGDTQGLAMPGFEQFICACSTSPPR
jgi:hypothetical protein